MAENKIDNIARDVKLIKLNLIEKVPTHFSADDIIRAFFGALFMGLTFILKGQIFRVGAALQTNHIILILVSTLVILTGEIYFIGYKRVPEKKQRKFCQFWLKRISTFVLAGLAVSSLLIYLYGIDLLAGSDINTIKLVVVVFMPCAIGAGMADLLKKY